MKVEDIIIIEESTVTARGYRHRTTIPRNIFRYLKLRDKDKLKWILLKDGTVVLKKATSQYAITSTQK